MPTEDDAAPKVPFEVVKSTADFFAARLENALKQIDQLDTRTSVLVSSSGGLIAVVGVLTALFEAREENFGFVPWSLITLGLSIVLLLAAVLLAQSATLDIGRRVDVRRLTERSHLLYEIVSSPAGRANLPSLEETSYALSNALMEVSEANRRRQRWLRRAGFCQLAGVIGLGFGVMVLMLGNLG
jgi:hypothetical protein